MKMAAGKVEVLMVVGGFDVDGCAEVRLVTKMSISRKVTWEGEMVQVNRTG